MSNLRELRELERIIELGRRHLRADVVCTVAAAGEHFPVYRLTLGSADTRLPAVGFFGGVHGLERIGTQVLLYFLHNLITRLDWDQSLHFQLQHMRLVFMPLVNPGGMWQFRRSNPNGVDLMRNAPLEAEGEVPFLLGGHRISPHLAWYRGKESSEMEAEAQALCSVVHHELMARPFSIAVDCHSGYGMLDRVWMPYAYSANPMPHLAEVIALEELFRQTHPTHRYVFEPQSLQYQTHGDLWDYLYLQSQHDTHKTFLPLTLEMGSWMWVKKNPWQFFSRLGLFNPTVEHRLHRVMRRHTVLLDFLMRAACSYRHWRVGGARRSRLQELAIERWYGQARR